MALNYMVLRSLLSLSILVLSAASAKDSAWNGHTAPGSTTPSPFTPYYVPPGAKMYDSDSPLIMYKGTWIDSFSPSYVQKSLRWTSHANASIFFTFTGTGIEWFGNLDKTHGVAHVHIDGSPAQTVDLWNSISLKQQRVFWRFNLLYGKHTIKIINTGKRRGSLKCTRIDLDAFVVTKGAPPRTGQAPELAGQPRSLPSSPRSPSLKSNQAQDSPLSQWSLLQQGSTGVHAMQLAIISPIHAIIIDKVEHNPVSIDGHPAWVALYNLKTHAIKPLTMQSNSFCAGGTFLGNGSMINVGGNPVVNGFTSSADFGDLDGLQAVRIIEPCDDDPADCKVYENHARIRMASPRWYNTVVRISDGSAMVIGGSKKGGWINNATVNNPTIEFFPPKSIHGSNGLPIHLPFLVDTLNSNLFPIAFSLTDGTIFVAANNDAMIYDWKTNTERRLPQIPNGVRVTYPMTGTGLLLPLSPDNNYTPEVLLCGGSTVDDRKAGYEISSKDPATSQCSRLVLTDEGIAAGWQIEQMPQARIMPDAVLLPTGVILIVNGAGSGISGYGNVIDQIGMSNAGDPVLTPVLYNPAEKAGERFSTRGMPTSSIPRLYHSVATLTPNGDIMVTGSNPNLDRSEEEYGTEYRVEWIGPPYMKMNRPSIISAASKSLGFGQTLQLIVGLPTQPAEIKVSLMDLGYVTHAVHANSRLVHLVSSLTPLGDGNHTMTITGPPNGNVYPPGPGWLYVIVDGVPSIGMKIMVGDGKGPAVDTHALKNLLAHTAVDQYEASRKRTKVDGSE